jgi:hypothetical protein
MKLAPQITGCKRHLCTCSHWEIHYIRGYFRIVKVPSSPYKRGREGTCKGVHNFWGEYKLLEILCLQVVTFVHLFLTLVFGDSIRFFGPPTKIKLTLDGCVLLLFFCYHFKQKTKSGQWEFNQRKPGLWCWRVWQSGRQCTEQIN